MAAETVSLGGIVTVSRLDIPSGRLGERSDPLTEGGLRGPTRDSTHAGCPSAATTVLQSPVCRAISAVFYAATTPLRSKGGNRAASPAPDRARRRRLFVAVSISDPVGPASDRWRDSDA